MCFKAEVYLRAGKETRLSEIGACALGSIPHLVKPRQIMCPAEQLRPNLREVAQRNLAPAVHAFRARLVVLAPVQHDFRVIRVHGFVADRAGAGGRGGLAEGGEAVFNAAGRAGGAY